MERRRRGPEYMTIRARSRSTRARCSSSSGPASAAASSDSAASNAPACSLACAAASARCARRAGSGVSSAARSRNAAPAATPAASLGPLGGSVELGGDLLVGRRGGPGTMPRPAVGIEHRIGRVGDGAMRLPQLEHARRAQGGGAHQRMAEPDVTRRSRSTPRPRRPPPRRARCPSLSIARQSRIASPVGSTAAVRSRRRVSAPSGVSRRMKLSSTRLASGIVAGSPNPPASSAGVKPRGSSSSAKGLPRVSATIRSRTTASSGPTSAPSSRLRASPSPSPSICSSGRPRKCWSSATGRAANTRATDSASRRRATNASICAETGSSHCASSTRQTTGLLLGDRRQQAEHRQPHEEAVRRRPPAQAERRGQRLALRAGKAVEMVQHRRAELMQAGERELDLGLVARHARDPTRRRALRAGGSAAPSCRRLPRRAGPAPGSAPPARSPPARSSVSHSLPRPNNAGALGRPSAMDFGRLQGDHAADAASFARAVARHHGEATRGRTRGRHGRERRAPVRRWPCPRFDPERNEDHDRSVEPRLRRHRHRRRFARRALCRRSGRGRPAGRDRGARAARRRVLLLGVHPVQDAAASGRGAGGGARRAGRSRGAHGRGRRLVRAGVARLHDVRATTTRDSRRGRARPASTCCAETAVWPERTPSRWTARPTRPSTSSSPPARTR